jgi:hypothetical protein
MSVCDKSPIFPGLPPCQRAATIRLEVEVTTGHAKGAWATVDVCEPCAGMLGRENGLKVKPFETIALVDPGTRRESPPEGPFHLSVLGTEGSIWHEGTFHECESCLVACGMRLAVKDLPVGPGRKTTHDEVMMVLGMLQPHMSHIREASSGDGYRWTLDATGVLPQLRVAVLRAGYVTHQMLVWDLVPVGEDQTHAER